MRRLVAAVLLCGCARVPTARFEHRQAGDCPRPVMGFGHHVNPSREKLCVAADVVERDGNYVQVSGWSEGPCEAVKSSLHVGRWTYEVGNGPEAVVVPKDFFGANSTFGISVEDDCGHLVALRQSEFE